MSARIIYSDNHYIITYFKCVNKNYCLHLQVLDLNGRPQFGGDGLMISDHPQRATTLSDLIVDKKGNILVAFCDTRNGPYSDITVYKMDLAGNQLWGENGINFFIPDTNDAGPRMLVNPDNSVTICFGSFNKVVEEPLMQTYLYRISENGILLWNGEPNIIKDEFYDISPLGIMGLADGGLLLAYRMSIFDSPGGQIVIKRIDVNGRDFWPKDLIVTNQCVYYGTNVQTRVGQNGIFYLTWETDCYGAHTSTCIQGVTPDGSFLWPEPGVRLSEDKTVDHYGPAMQGFTSDGDVFVLWYYITAPPHIYNLMGQLVSPDGELKWGEHGLRIKNKCGLNYSGSIINDTAIILYRDEVFDLSMFEAVKAVALKMDGTFCWQNEVTVNDTRTSKAIYGFTPIVNNQGVVVLTEGHDMFPEDRLMVQNIWTDGTLGLKSSATNPLDFKPGIRAYFRSEEGIIIDGITGPCEIMIYNTLGQCLHQGKVTETGIQAFKVNTPQWNPGIYFIKILQQGEKVTCSKILIN
jgi:hypothetical protein